MYRPNGLKSFDGMKKSEKTRRFIIEQSAPIFNKKGVAGTSISDVMESTRLAKGGIYGNFDSKEEISAEVFDYLAGLVFSGLDKATQGKTTAREKLFAILDYHYNNVATGETGGCPMLNFGTEADDTNQALRQRVAKAIKKNQQRVIRLVEEGQSTGEFNKQTDAGVFAIKMFTMIEGGIFASRVTGNKGLMKTVVDVLRKEIGGL
jgi:TetR/AcrR family transcriptional regulator, transcriptional repressor for nem operon